MDTNVLHIHFTESSDILVSFLKNDFSGIMVKNVSICLKKSLPQTQLNLFR